MTRPGLGSPVCLLLTLYVIASLPSWSLQTNSGKTQMPAWSELMFYSMCNEDTQFMIHSVPNRCDQYIVCSGGQMITLRCPRGYVFNDYSRRCQAPSPHQRLRCSRELLASMPYTCMWQPYRRVASYVSCAQYFDCQTGRGPRGTTPSYVTECPYPKLFSMVTRRCEPFYKVSCQGRAVPKAPCDYLQYQQLYEGTTEPCVHHHPSCVRRRDGQYRVTNSTRSFFVCHSERTINIGQCKTGVFSDVTQRCERSISLMVNAQRIVPTGLSAQTNVPTILSGLNIVPTVFSGQRTVPTVQSSQGTVQTVKSGQRTVPTILSGLNNVPTILSGLSNVPTRLSGQRTVPTVLSGQRTVPTVLSGQTPTAVTGNLQRPLPTMIGPRSPVSALLGGQYSQYGMDQDSFKANENARVSSRVPTVLNKRAVGFNKVL